MHINPELLEGPNVTGPEALAFDRLGRGPFIGVADGRVLKYGGLSFGFTHFAYTTPTWYAFNCSVYIMRMFDFLDVRTCLITIFDNCFFLFLFLRTRKTQRTCFDYQFFFSEKCAKKRRLNSDNKTIFKEHQNCVLCVFKNGSQKQFSKIGTKLAFNFPTKP